LAVPSLSKTHGLFILKLRRSGSTFFTSLITQQDGVWVVPQLIRQGTAKGQTENETLQTLATALDQPYSAKKADLQALNNEWHHTPIVGYSMNPMHNASSIFLSVEGVRSLLAARNVTVVLYQRTNLVKHSVAALRSTCLTEKCGISNPINTETAGMWQKAAQLGFRHDLIPGSAKFNSTVACDIGKRHFYPIQDLQCAIVWHYDAFIAMRKYTAAIAPKFQAVYYEALQRNASGVLEKLFRNLDHAANDDFDALPPRQLRLTEFTVKHTADSLRETIINFDQVLQSLGVGCLIDMLMNVEPRTMPAANCIPPPAWRETCNQILVTANPNRVKCDLMYEDENHRLVPVVDYDAKYREKHANDNTEQ